VTRQADLIGRRDELGWLAAALARAAAGESRAVFVAGETGIGKTRLIDEALGSARAAGFRVLTARAFPVDGSLGYALFLDALGPYLRGLEPVRRATLLSGLARLGRLFDGLGLPGAEVLGDAALEKTRLFEAVVRLVERLADAAPLALFFDDLHWADPSSLEMLQYLVRGVRNHRVVVVGAYRCDEVEPARRLRRALAALSHAGLAEEIQLKRLMRHELAALTRGLLAADPPPELIDMLDQRTGGTPLYVEGVVRAMVEAGQLVEVGSGAEASWVLSPGSGSVLPAGLRSLVLDRVDRLEDDDRSLLSLVAVYAEAVPRRVLREASGLTDGILGACVERLRGAGLLAEQIDDIGLAYRVPHPLIQEVTYAELSETARRRGHRAFVAVLELMGHGQAGALTQDLLRLARHYRGADGEADEGRALEVLIAAADQARRLHSNEEAAGYYRAALRLARASGQAHRLPVLLEHLGEVWGHTGENVAAIAAWTEALEHAARLDVQAVARLHRRLALAEWDRPDFAAAQHHVGKGIAALASAPPCAELIELMHVRLTLEMRLRDRAAATTTAAELVALGQRLGSPQAIAEGYLAEAIAHLARGAYPEALARTLDALASADEIGDVLLVKRVLDTLTRMAFFLGEIGAARRAAERSLRISRELDAPSTELYPRFHLVLLDLAAGNLRGALRASADALALARRLDRPRALAGSLAGRAMALTYLGALDEAAPLIEEARGAYGAGSTADHNIARSVDLAEALLALERGDPLRAATLGAELAQSVSVGANPPLGLAVYGEAQVSTGDPGGGLETARALAELGPADSYPSALSARIRGLARRALGETEHAVELLAEAAGAFEAAGMPLETTRTRYELSLALAERDRHQAEATARQSLADFEQMGALRWAQRTRHLLREMGVRRSGGGRQGRGAAGNLSARQLEIARLVADGLANNEIAEALVLSPRTVTTHLDHIYRRLGLNSRAALTRYVVESGLIPPRARR
jgi:DNA-binding CsgD family transcriptional regulator/tetratricopeptide (TPR) repeat protein